MDEPTPGPWRAETTNQLAYYAVHHWVDGESMCLPHSEANARLIVAAPEMLDALEKAIAPYHGREMTGATAAWVMPARAAIAKAKGEAA